MGKQRLQLTGNRYGRWLVVADTGKVDHKKRSLWHVVCDCGSEREIAAEPLTRGKSKSCGCYQSDWTIEKHTKHGMHGTPTYVSWNSMVARCTVKSHRKYASYGGAGITVCERWRDFASFLEDMGERPENTSIDRIDGTRGYEPGNCRWATHQDQNRNRSVSIWFYFNRAIRHIDDIAKVTGIPRSRILRRIRENRMTIYEAVTLPLRKRNIISYADYI